MTKEELFNYYKRHLSDLDGKFDGYFIDESDFKEVLVKFAKHHVRLALKEASEKEKLDFDCTCDLVVNKKKLNFFINSYNLENIK